MSAVKVNQSVDEKTATDFFGSAPAIRRGW